MGLLIKAVLGLVGLMIVGGLVIVFFRPLSLKLRGIKSEGVTVLKDAVYLDGERIQGADPGSFKDLGMGYCKDKSHVFFFRDVMAGIDPSQFRKLNQNPNDYSFRDDRQIFLGGVPVPGADPNSFELLGDGIYRDKAQVFWGRQPRPEIDVGSFKYLGLGYGKDKNHVFQFGSQGGLSDGQLKIVDFADPKTFELVPGAQPLASVPTEVNQKPDSKDKNRQYRNGAVLSK